MGFLPVKKHARKDENMNRSHTEQIGMVPLESSVASPSLSSARKSKLTLLSSAIQQIFRPQKTCFLSSFGVEIKDEIKSNCD